MLSIKIFLRFCRWIYDKRKSLLIERFFTLVATASYKLFLRGIFTWLLVDVCLLDFLERFITYRTVKFDRAIFNFFNITPKFFEYLQKLSYFIQMILFTFFKYVCYGFFEYYLGWYLFIR